MAVSLVNGNITIVYSSDPAGTDRSDISLVTSTNGGASFSLPARVNSDSTTKDQFMPSVSVNANGSVAVMWYDRRNSSKNTAIDVYASISGTNRRVTDVTWSLGRVQSGLRHNYHGDYNQLCTDGIDFLLPWGDERSGDADVGYRTYAP